MERAILTGAWIVRDRAVVGDDVCAEIKRLLAEDLVELGRDESGWYTLFRDRRDGQFWERSYPQSELHGGGPPQLAPISTSD